MGDLLDGDRVRVLVAPCGCIGAADATDEVPGFCRTIEEAREDVRDGFTESSMSLAEFRSSVMRCDHTPQYGRPS